MQELEVRFWRSGTVDLCACERFSSDLKIISLEISSSLLAIILSRFLAIVLKGALDC
jgi:hypothetical protein